MKKKFLACTLAALMCLQPASAVLAEDLDFGEDSTGITEESHLLTEENTEDISDFISSDEEQDSSVSDAEPDLANTDIPEADTEYPADEISPEFSDNFSDSLPMEPDSDVVSEPVTDNDFDDGSVLLCIHLSTPSGSFSAPLWSFSCRRVSPCARPGSPGPKTPATSS